MIFVFDCESIGLHGETYAVAGGLYRVAGAIPMPVEEFCYAINPTDAEGQPEDRAWVAANVPPIEVTHTDGRLLRDAFWGHWRKAHDQGALIYVECGWPVEARFLSSCVERDASRTWDGPYPLHEVASFMAAAGMDPMKRYERMPMELPEHHPLGDARLSARLLCEAWARLA